MGDQMDMLAAEVCREALMLDNAARLATSEPSAAFRLLAEVKETGHLGWLRTSVIALVHHAIVAGPLRECDIRREFYNNLSSYLPGAVAISRTPIASAQPDGFVSWRNNECPVEVKRRTFDLDALQQLRRYMAVYDAQCGIAVAPALQCELPNNVVFVEVQ